MLNGEVVKGGELINLEPTKIMIRRGGERIETRPGAMASPKIPIEIPFCFEVLSRVISTS